MTTPDIALEDLPAAQLEDDAPASDPAELVGDLVDDDLDGPQ